MAYDADADQMMDLFLMKGMTSVAPMLAKVVARNTTGVTAGPLGITAVLPVFHL